MDGHDDDISILSDFEEDSSSTNQSVIQSLARFSDGSSNVPASTHALKTAYQDLRHRYNELQHQNKVLRRKRSVVGGQRMASENVFFSDSNGSPVDIREQGAAAMADSILDGQLRQGHINNLQLQLKQSQAKYNSIATELNQTQKQFEGFRAKHARCYQEKEELLSQIKKIEIEKRKLIETVERLKAKVADQTCINCKRSTSKNIEDGPASFPGTKQGVCVSLDDFKKLQKQIRFSEENICTLQKLLEEHTFTIQDLFGGQFFSDNTDRVAGLKKTLPSLKLFLQDKAETGLNHIDAKHQERLPAKDYGDLRSRLERQEQVLDDTESFVGSAPYLMAQTKASHVLSDHSKSELLPSENLIREKLSSGFTFNDSTLDSNLASNVKRKEAQNAVDRVVSAISRTSSTPQPSSHLLRVSKEPVARTSSTPVSPGAVNDKHMLISDSKSPTMLDSVQIPCKNLSQTILQKDLTKQHNPSSTRDQQFLTADLKQLTHGFEKSSISPSAIQASNPLPAENCTYETNSENQRKCPICGGAFSRLTMTEFQNHVFDCYDNTDSGERERPEASSNNAEVNLASPIDRKCPVCEAPFDQDIPQTIFERHVEEHFDEAPLNNDDFTILHP